MATRNRNRTQRKNKNRSRRNKNHHGGAAAAMTCSEAQQIMNGTRPGSKLFAGVKIRSECKKGPNGKVLGEENTSGTVAPNQRWSMATRSRRNRRQGGGAASMSCNEAASINANPNSYGMVKKMAAKVQLKSCASGSKNVVAPNAKWATKGAFIRPNTVTSRCEEENPDGTCKDNLMHRSPELNM
jgi:hypothetical protein